MSDDENFESKTRFNKFENSCRNLETNFQSFVRNTSLKRAGSNESLVPNKKVCTNPADGANTLNKTWSGNSTFTSIMSSDSTSLKFSANNRLKKLRDNIELSKSNNNIPSEKPLLCSPNPVENCFSSTSKDNLVQNKCFEVQPDLVVQKSSSNLNKWSSHDHGFTSTNSPTLKPFNFHLTGNFDVSNKKQILNSDVKTIISPEYMCNSKNKQTEIWKNSTRNYNSNLNDQNTSVPFMFKAGESNNTNKWKSQSNEYSNIELSVEEVICTPTSVEKDISLNGCDSQLALPKQLPTPVNIYKNMDKWSTPDTKSSKRSLANERLKRLKTFVNTSGKDNIHISTPSPSLNTFQKENHDISFSNPTSASVTVNTSFKNNIINDPNENLHVSPLLRGLKRPAPKESFSECSDVKKIALDLKTTQSRSMRLVQQALSQEVIDTSNFSTDKNVFAKPVIQKSLSNRLEVKPDLIEANQVLKLSKSGSVSVEKPVSLTHKSQNQEKKSSSSGSKLHGTESDSEYQQKMKMTASWVASCHLMKTSHYNLYSDVETPVEKVLQVDSPEELKENPSELEDMEWTNVSIL